MFSVPPWLEFLRNLLPQRHRDTEKRFSKKAVQLEREFANVSSLSTSEEMSAIINQKDWSQTPLGPVFFVVADPENDGSVSVGESFSFADLVGTAVLPALQRRLPPDSRH